MSNTKIAKVKLKDVKSHVAEFKASKKDKDKLTMESDDGDHAYCFELVASEAPDIHRDIVIKRHEDGTRTYEIEVGYGSPDGQGESSDNGAGDTGAKLESVKLESIERLA